MKCKGSLNRETIYDDELADAVGYKCKVTGTIIPWEVEDDIRDKCYDCPIN
jgi:hypothetical protein